MSLNPESSPTSRRARLLAIVAVAPARRVMCQNPGCGHGVYAAIHVVEDHGTLMVLGSTCFAKRYGSTNALGLPSYSAGGGGGGTLDEAERQMLMENTAALMALFKERHDSAMALAEAKLRAMRERATQHHAARRAQLAPTYTRPLQSLPQHPWPWQHQQNTSVGVVRGADGQCWVRVQHRDGTQKLAPWPAFDGWDEVLPPSVGVPDLSLTAYAVKDVVMALQWLRARGFSAPAVSRWPEVLKILPSVDELS